ncbi:anti-sigma factor [Paracoccus suum]|uniref:Anti-sigma factor n=1 Tax=Paracoccus suum TaxID=2259340 RepID=A0A344PMJ7_9RHOB|nr:anti-sigma factor [Paracoccus suum]AXC50602.1 anti-sigma factor [Paracoccus suum]
MSEQIALTDHELLGYASASLPPAEATAIAARLAGDAAARATLAEWQRQDAALAALYQAVAREPVPTRLTDVIRRAEAEDVTRTGGRPWTSRWQIAATVAALALGVGAGWFARDLAASRPAAHTLASDAMRAYDTYVVEVAHPVEVAASDADHLNTWMSKRLGHQMRPPDFAAVGFTLMGGRIVPSEKGPAALYMYDNAAGQRITLYVAPQGASTTTAFQFAQEGPTQGFYWMDRDLSYAVVGTVPRSDLRRIALAAYEQLI